MSNDMPAAPVQGFTADASGALCGQYIQSTGLTIRQHACIALRIPETGDTELDALIQKAQRRDIAAMAMQGFLSGTPGPHLVPQNLAMHAVEQVDALLAALEQQP